MRFEFLNINKNNNCDGIIYKIIYVCGEPYLVKMDFKNNKINELKTEKEIIDELNQTQGLINYLEDSIDENKKIWIEWKNEWLRKEKEYKRKIAILEQKLKRK